MHRIVYTWRIDRRSSHRLHRLPLLASGIAAVLAACGDSPPTGSQRGDTDETQRAIAAASAALPREAIRGAEDLLAREIDRGAFPGAAVAVGIGGEIVHVSGLGRVGWTDAAEPVEPDRTLYDLASLTKAVATTTAVMLLVEDGRLRLDDPVSHLLPEFGGGEETGVTIRQLLTHTAGVRAGYDPGGETAEQVRRELISHPPVLEPGADVLYSDVGFVVLWTAAERAAGEPLPRFLKRRVFDPLGMRATVFGPVVGCPRCAPTLRLSDGEPYRGGSYDHTARRLEGLAGNAGLFSTAHDLARFAAMIANGGELDGVRVLQEGTIRTFFSEQSAVGTRALGWEFYCREGIVPDQKACEGVYAIGHTGITGTSLWIDPKSGAWVVLLTNRVYEPRAEIRMQELRRELFERVTARGPVLAVAP